MDHHERNLFFLADLPLEGISLALRRDFLFAISSCRTVVLGAVELI